MNRKATGIILSIAAVSLLAGILCRPSGRPILAERHAVQTSAAPSLPTTEATRVVGALSAAPLLSTREPESPKGQVLAVSGLSVPESAVQDDGEFPPGATVDKATLIRLHGEQPLTAEHPHVHSAIEIQERNSQWLMALPSVDRK